MSSVFPAVYSVILDESLLSYPTIILSLLLSIIVLLSSLKKRNAFGIAIPHATVPGPRWTWPVLGYLPNLGRYPHRKLTSLRYEFGDIYQIQMGSWPTIVLNGMDTIKQALYKQAEDFAGRPGFFSFDYLAKGKSMGFANFGPRWKLHRKIAQNALASVVNDRSNPIEVALQEEAKVLVHNLSTTALKTGDKSVNPHDEIYLSVGNIICALCFGKRYRRNDPDFIQLIKMNSDFMAFMGAGNPVDILPWMRPFAQRSFRNFLSILDTMDKFCDRKRDEHIASYKPDRIRDITDALLTAVTEVPESDKLRVGLTDEHILVTVQELIGAGFDTIATTIEWAVLFLATNPEFQTLAQKEIDLHIGKERDPTVQDIGFLPVTEAIMYETMRHSCIFPLALPHSTTRDTHLNGYFIPAQTLVFANMWSVTRDAEVFPDPEAFNPNRFLSQDKSKLLKQELDKFQPFGIGKRRCPGEQLGKMEIFIFLVSLLQKCTFQTIPNANYTLEAKYGLTLKPQDYKVKVTCRD